ncbi:MAG: hypothetical protein VX768_21255 [Planctomycetota bacterium]|nr:hypothetical protein [Planctomycetota bacterium]
MASSRRSFLGTMVSGLSVLIGTSAANSIFKFNFGISEDELVGVWRWNGDPDKVSYYELAEDRSVVGYMDGVQLSDRGNWVFEQGRLYISVIDAPVSFCYQVVDSHSFRQLYWMSDGAKETTRDDPGWVRVDKLPFPATPT